MGRSESTSPRSGAPARSARAMLCDRRTIVGAILVLLAFFPFIVGRSGYLLYTAAMAGVTVIGVIGLNILTGVAGQVSIGHAGFMALGAYFSGIVANRVGVPFWISIPMAGLFAGAIGALLGIPALRLKGHYLAIATLGFSEAVRQLVEAFGSLTGGYNGLKPAKPVFFGISLSSDIASYYIVLVVTGLMILVARNLLRSRPGRAFAALRDSEVAAQAMGVNLAAYKTAAFGVSAFYAGIAGALQGHVVGFISPSQYNLGYSLMLLGAVVVGGMASIEGSILGALFITIVPLLFTRMEFVSSIVTGVALILSVIFLPYGLASVPWVIADGRAKARRARSAHASAAAAASSQSRDGGGASGASRG